MELATVLELIASVLVALGVLVITIAVIGMLRMPDIYTRLHAASKSVVLGVVALLAVSAVVGAPGQIARAGLIGIFVLLTAPLSAHAIGRAAENEGGMPEE